MKKFILLFSILGLLSCSKSNVVNWHTGGFDTLLAKAKSGQKPIMAEFYTDW